MLQKAKAGRSSLGIACIGHQWVVPGLTLVQDWPLRHGYGRRELARVARALRLYSDRVQGRGGGFFVRRF
jgi:hypothetical protein